MVANQARFKDAEKLMVKLEKDEGGRYVKNSDLFQRKTLECFRMYDLECFLHKDSGIEVPSAQAVSSSLERDLEEKLAVGRKTRARDSLARMNAVKQEGRTASSAAALSGSTPRRPHPPNEPESSEGGRKNPIVVEETFMEKLMRRNVEKLKRERLEELARQTEQGFAKAPVLFVDPLSICPLSEFEDAKTEARADGRPLDEFDALNITIELDGVECACKAEDKALVTARMLSFNLLFGAVSGVIDKHILNRVSVGNTFALWTVVREDLTHNRRGAVVESLQERFDGLALKKNELFGTFVARFATLTSEMEMVNMVVDPDLVRNKIVDIMDNANTIVKSVWDMASNIDNFESVHPLVVLNSMLDQVKRKEMSKKRREEAEGHKLSKKERKEKARVMLEAATALKVQTTSQAAGTGSSRPDLRGICLFFQEDNCRREGCTFTHRKLSKADKEILAKMMKDNRARAASAATAATSGAAAITCFTCGKTGHISPVCPQKKVFAGSAHTAPAGVDGKLAAALQALEGLSAAEKLAFANQLCGTE